MRFCRYFFAKALDFSGFIIKKTIQTQQFGNSG